jgi:VWFA-related protein
MRIFKLIFFVMVVAGLFLTASAQDKNVGNNDDVIRVDTQLVDVPIAVTSLAGKPVGSLKKSNFVVFEDDKPQEIVDFSTTTAPFEVALLLDTSGSTRSDLQLIQRAAMDFISSLRPGDRVAVIAFGTERGEKDNKAVSRVAAPLTSDRKILMRAIENVETSFGTPYYDSLVQIAERVFQEKAVDEYRGRRAIVALTDGVDSTSLANFEEVKRLFGQLGLISFFIQVDTREFFEENLLGDCQTATRFSAAQIRRYYRSLNAKGTIEKAASFCQLGEFERLAVSKQLYVLADMEMNELASTSGGKVFPVADLGEARNAFRSVADEIGTKYTLGYYPTNEKRDGTYRKIKVELKGLPAGTKVRAREGYTAPSN